MPPKAKFTKKEVIAAALEMVKEDGIEILTARALGERLGSSARPVFTLFDGMEEIKAEVINAAKRLYERYEDDGMCGEQAFKGSGIGYIKFALYDGNKRRAGPRKGFAGHRRLLRKNSRFSAIRIRFRAGNSKKDISAFVDIFARYSFACSNERLQFFGRNRFGNA